MIDLDRVGFTYDGDAGPTLRDVSLSIDEGELVLLVGRTGVGKSTLLGTFNGLVPHFTGGHLDGMVTVAGVRTRSRPPRELAHLVGYVGQDPLAGFVTDTVEDELAYGMEQLGVPPQAMRRRVEDTLDLLGIADLRRRALRTLSGGQQQRVAIGSVLTMNPPVLVLDEPTSALDPTAAEEVLATLARLVHDLGTTVVLAEHRMERVVPFADRMLWVAHDGRVTDGAPGDLLRHTPIAPPVVELGRLSGWDPLPLTVRDARRRAGPLRDKLNDAREPAGRHTVRGSGPPARMTSGDGEVLRATGVTVRYGATVAVRDVDVSLAPGDVLAVMGRNGSGKSSLLWAIQGAGPHHGGTVRADGRVGMVPQTASDLLYLESVREECEAGDREAAAAPGTCRALLERIAPGIDDTHHPR
ncbi:MAG: ATP-binding cassette domain-containing protein, partial [Nocardioidaceae bacterium]